MLDAVEAGLAVDLNVEGLRSPTGNLVSDETVLALADAVREALRNVEKHAGVRHAVVRVWPEAGGVLVTVVDQGRGFGPGLVGGSVGIATMAAHLGVVGARPRSRVRRARERA